MRIIQFVKKDGERAVGIVEGESIRILSQVRTSYDLFNKFILDNKSVENSIAELASSSSEKYADIIEENRLLVPLDHPDPYHSWITGTGLTHLGSAASRNSMHARLNDPNATITDSMKMFQMGVENGKMKDNQPASQPEWFYKGNGLIAVHPGHSITSPSFAMDGGEEPEIAGIYIINASGNPERIGFALGNEFSDHKMEKINYLYLAHSKLRSCSYGPELLIGNLPSHIEGQSRIIRNNSIVWEKQFLTGEDNMSHNIANLEHHHFKYELFRQPGDVHIHFFGTSLLSFVDNIQTEAGDTFEIESEVFGKPLRNSLVIRQANGKKYEISTN